MLGKLDQVILRLMSDNRRKMDKTIDLHPEHGETTPHGVAVLATDPPANALIARHTHRRGQLLYATSGVMIVRADTGSWVVPPGRAVWIAPGVAHEIELAGTVAMRTVFVEPDLCAGLGGLGRVIHVSALLQQLILSGAQVPLDHAPGGRDERLMALILDEIYAAPTLSLHVPLPQHPGLTRLCRGFIADASAPATLQAWARILHMNERTLARQFRRETGMTFGAWRRQTRLLLSLPRLAAGVSILQVALEHGYDSPSAFTAMFRKALGVPPSLYISPLDGR